MATLKENIEAIKLEKDTKILPENLKSGVTAFGIEGNLKEKVKVFSSIDEMNNSTNNADGDVCLIFGLDPVVPNSEGFSANTMILPETIPLDAGIDFEGMNGLSSKDNGSGITLTCYGWSNTTIGDVYISFDGGGGGLGIYCYSQDTSTNCYKRNYKYSADYGPYLMLNHNDMVIESLSSGRDYTLGELVVENPDSNIWDYIRFANITTIDVYVYNGLASTWTSVRNEMITKPENIEIGKVAYVDGGVITGTMDLSAKKSLNTIYAYVSKDFGPFEYDSETKEYHYEETLNSPTKPIVLDITSAPENFGDKRYLLVCSFDEMMGGTYYTFLWFDDPDKVLYYQNTMIDGGRIYIIESS